jgi:hypothetical protein
LVSLLLSIHELHKKEKLGLTISTLITPYDGIYKKYESKNFVYSSLEESDISSEYIGWLNDTRINTFLDAGKTQQDFLTVANYVNFLRSFKDCDLFTIKYKRNMLHVGNLTITYNANPRVGTYGLMIGLSDNPVGSIAAIEASIAMIDYIFYEQKKDIDIQEVNPANVRALKVINFLGFKESQMKSTRGYLVFEISNSDWFSQRKNYNHISGRACVTK